jgi:hypothetical protein
MRYAWSIGNQRYKLRILLKGLKIAFICGSVLISLSIKIYKMSGSMVNAHVLLFGLIRFANKVVLIAV